MRVSHRTAVGIGHSDSDDTVEATRAALRASLEQCGSAPALVMALFAPGHDPRAVRSALGAAGGGAEVVGCRVPGLIVRDRVYRQGVAVMAVGGPGLLARAALADGADHDPRGSGRRAARGALQRLEMETGPADWDRTVLLSFADVHRGDGVEIVAGIGQAVTVGTRIAGGGAAEDGANPRTAMFVGEDFGAVATLCVALRQDTAVGLDLRHGCAPHGAAMNVTRSLGRQINELDFESAFVQYARFAASRGYSLDSAKRFAEFAMLHPLGLQQEGGGYVLRCLLGYDGDGTIQCCSSMPQPAVVRIMGADRSSLLDAARQAARASRAPLMGRAPALDLVFACPSRDAVLGTTVGGASADLSAAREALGRAAPMFGALTVGQFGSLAGAPPAFHADAIEILCCG
ncbi:MAG: FIST N-terminal domain-containing protein [Planctomycetota bacterium]